MRLATAPSQQHVMKASTVHAQDCESGSPAAAPLAALVNCLYVTCSADMVEYCYNLRTVATQYTKTWLVLDVVSCLPVECMIRAGGVVHSYNLGHVNRWVADTASCTPCSDKGVAVCILLKLLTD